MEHQISGGAVRRHPAQRPDVRTGSTHRGGPGPAESLADVLEGAKQTSSRRRSPRAGHRRRPASARSAKSCSRRRCASLRATQSNSGVSAAGEEWFRAPVCSGESRDLACPRSAYPLPRDAPSGAAARFPNHRSLTYTTCDLSDPLTMPEMRERGLHQYRLSGRGPAPGQRRRQGRGIPGFQGVLDRETAPRQYLPHGIRSGEQP
jgi:hypothetical protein